MRTKWIRAFGVTMVLIISMNGARVMAQEEAGSSKSSAKETPASVSAARFEGAPFWLDGVAAKNAADRVNAWNKLSSCQQKAFLRYEASRPPSQLVELAYMGGAGAGNGRSSFLKSVKEYIFGKPAYADCGSSGNLACAGPFVTRDDPPQPYYCCTPPSHSFPCYGTVTYHHWGVYCNIDQAYTCDECAGQASCQTVQGMCQACSWADYDCNPCCAGCLRDIQLPCKPLPCQCNETYCSCSTDSTCSPPQPECHTWDWCPTTPYPFWLQHCP